MIRRSFEFADGVCGWSVISQLEHARVAGLLANYWGAPGFAEPVPRQEVLEAVFRHDDGWAAWEQQPDVDPRGFPRDFTEMPIHVSVEIWRRSIREAAQLGPLVAWVVSGHFSALVRRFGHAENAHQADAIRDFLAEQDAERARWLDQWQAISPEQHSLEIAERALAQLQFFDLFSLWLCCDGPKSVWTPEPPGGEPFTMRPAIEEPPPAPRAEQKALEGQRSAIVAASRAVQRIRIRAHPWPFSTDRVVVDVEARAYQQRTFAGAEAFRTAPATPLRIVWEFTPTDTATTVPTAGKEPPREA